MSVYVFLDEDDQLVISKDSQAGEPCLCIPVNRDTVWIWIYVLMQAVEDGEYDGDLPGDMKVIRGPEEPLIP